MKTNYFLMILIVITGVFFACTENEPAPSQEGNPLQAETESISEIQQTVQMAQVISRGGNANFLNGRVRDIVEGGRLAEGDSVECDSDFWGIETCAEITLIVKPAEAIAVILDFGDGCEQNGVTISGILVHTYYEVEGKFAYHVAFKNFRVNGTTINGDAHAVWTTEGPAEENQLNFIAAHTEDFLVLLRNGESFEYTAGLIAAENDHAFALLEGTVEASNSLGDEFNFDILEPVVVNYECRELGSFIPVDGLESYQYNEKAFTVDFGDGECDNIYIIREGDRTITIDLGDKWSDEDDTANSVG